MERFKSFFTNLKIKIDQNVADAEIQFVPLGIAGLVGFFVFYFVWKDVNPQSYENMPLRFIAMVLSFGLVLKKYWPSWLQKWTALYWYTTLFYIMPFFFSFMTFKNDFSGVWLQNSMMALFFLILLANWVELLLLIIFGVGLGFLCYSLTSEQTYFPNDLSGILFGYAAILGVSGIFIHNKDHLYKEKLQTTASVGATVAHELRTPLASIELNGQNLKKHVPRLMETYQLVTEAKEERYLPKPPLAARVLNSLTESLEAIPQETYAAKMFIKMLLAKAGCMANQEDRIYPLGACITEAVVRYPFSGSQRELVECEAGDDFLVQGSPVLMEHVIFNLLKNSLYFVTQAGKGNIKIWLERAQNGNRLYFKDTGAGISPEVLPRIFDQFFTASTHHGSGIGLGFCKMVVEAHRGQIRCESKEGEFALFILSFPDDGPLVAVHNTGSMSEENRGRIQ